MHEIQAGRDCTARIEVISHSTAHVHSKREVLSLRIEHSLGALSVNVPDTQSFIKVGGDPRFRPVFASQNVSSNSYSIKMTGWARRPAIHASVVESLRTSPEYQQSLWYFEALCERAA